LSPAKISSIRLYEDERKAEVSLRPEEVSLAIGKNGLNIKLACMLTDYTIDVFRDIDAMDEEDIYLDEFADEIDIWVIDTLKNIGCNTAKAVLAMKREEIIERADLEEQTVDDLLSILAAEFEDEIVDQTEKAPEESPEKTEDAGEPVAPQPETAVEEAAGDRVPPEDAAETENVVVREGENSAEPEAGNQE
jgi:N utilization substance protein A